MLQYGMPRYIISAVGTEWNVPERSGDIESTDRRGPDRLRVLIVQDHPLLASAIALILDSEPDLSVCGIARSGADAAELAVSERAAVVLMDFRLPDMNGPAAADLMHAKGLDVAIVFHSAEDSESALLDAIDAGATAYLTKSATADQIVEAVRRAGMGDVLIPTSLFAKALARQRTTQARQMDHDRLASLFTARELDVLRLVAQGLGTAAMSDRLGVAPHTIEWHVTHVIHKLEVHSKLQAVISAARLGLIDLAEQ
jgi:DNA-binding NarL/FixJ family response regulator